KEFSSKAGANEHSTFPRRGGPMPLEYAFEIAAAAIRFGFGVTREVGAELADLGKSHVLVIADPNLRNLPPLAMVQESLHEHKIRFSVFDNVHIEPTDE